MSERSPKVLVQDMLDSITSIQVYTEGMDFESFMSDSKTRDAVIMHFIVIGETSSRLPEFFKQEHTDIPWSEIKGLRNRIAHDYFGIDFNIVWDIIHENLNGLSKQLRELI
jgi:uncharacterized protein with HEPN domain